jgi:hypothetical protein
MRMQSNENKKIRIQEIALNIYILFEWNSSGHLKLISPP